ncbi:MAG: hypothetical protein ABR563_03815 [Pyrinomonadaceae bacterium]
MSCQKFRAEIEEAARGAAPGAAASSHLADCVECRAFGEERERLRGLVASLARVEAPDDFEFRLRARMARAESADSSRARRRGFVPGAAWVAAAACLVVALGLFIHTPTTRQEVEPTAAASDAAKSDGAANKLAQATPPSGGRNLKRSSEGEPPDAGATPAKLTSATRDAARKHRFVVPREALRQLAEVQPEPRALGENVLAEGGLKIYTASPIPLPVNVPEQPLEVQFTDSRGASRVVSVDPVTFGARGLPAQRTRTTTAKFTPTQGVW